MPKVQFNKDNTGSITYDSNDWLAGMDTTSAGSDYGKMGGNPVMAEVDPLRSYGYISPGYLGVSSTNNGSITRILRSSAVNDSAAFIVSGGSLNSGLGSGAARIQQLTIVTNTFVNDANFPHTITAGTLTAVSGSDMTNYYQGTTLKAFYSYLANQGWDVGTLAYPSTFDDDFMSTVPTTPLGSPYKADGATYPHPVIVGDDDVFYMGDRNFLHAYDRSTNTFSAAVLTLPQGWVITCFCKTQDLRLAIGAYYATSSSTSTFNRSQAKVWYWSYGELDVDFAIDLKDNYVSEIIPWNNTIAVFTYGRKTLSDKGPNKLQAQVATQFVVLKTWGTSGSAQELPIRGGVDNVGNDLYWNASGQVMSYTKRPDNGEYILNNEVTVTTTESGSLKFYSASSIIHASFGITTDGMQSFSANYNDSGTLQCQVSTPEWPVRMKGDLTSISIKFRDTFTGGRSLRLSTKIDEGSKTMISDFQSSSSLRTVQIQKRSDGSPLGDFNSLQPQPIWSAGAGSSDCPVIEYIKYEFNLVNV